LLLQVVEQNPQHLMAWLWLSDLMDATEDRIVALENALTLQPDQPQVLMRLEQYRVELTAQQERQAARQEVRAEQPRPAAPFHIARQETAEPYATPAPDTPVFNDQSWVTIAPAMVLDDRVAALKKALAADPDNARLRADLAHWRDMRANPLLWGALCERKGQLEFAISAYRKACIHPRNKEEQREADRRLELAEARHQHPDIRVQRDSTELLRLMMGPLLLYVALLFVHGGLRFSSLPAVFHMGTLSVLLGSFLVTLTGLRPRHYLWLSYFGPPGETHDRYGRRLLGAAGWCLLLLPYLLLALNAMYRLRLFNTYWQPR